MQVGQVFALIFVVILIGFIFIFAMPMLGDFWKIGNQAEITKMIKDIEKSVDDLYWSAGRGSSEILTVTLPGDTRLCFIDPEKAKESVIWPETWKRWKGDEAIGALIESEGYNVWYITGETQNGYIIEHLSLVEDIQGKTKNFCVKSGIDIFLQNEGETVTVDLM